MTIKPEEATAENSCIVMNTCAECLDWRGVRPVVPYLESFGTRLDGICGSVVSDHYGHVLWHGHPSCVAVLFPEYTPEPTVDATVKGGVDGGSN